MVSNLSSTAPTVNPDGTISAIIHAIQPLPPAGVLLRLWLPITFDAGAGFARYFLARCVEDTVEARWNEWSIYARRVLFCAGMPAPLADAPGSIWDFLLPDNSDPGYRWLLRRPLHTSINLLGPFGQSLELAPHTRTLLVIAEAATLPLTLPAVQTMLDRGGRVTMLIGGEPEAAAPLLSLIPIPVEVHTIPADSWLDHLATPVRWADQLVAALPNAAYAPLAHHLRTLRFQLDDNYAHVLVQSDIICGYGGCLACVVATREGGYTRACQHGPLFPLTTLA